MKIYNNWVVLNFLSHKFDKKYSLRLILCINIKKNSRL